MDDLVIKGAGVGAGADASRIRSGGVAEPLSAPIMFWGLVLLGMCGLAPAILLPQWRAYQRSAVAEQLEHFRYEQMAQAVQRERQMADALRTDPALLSRIAQRELNLRPDNVESVPVEASAIGDATEPSVQEFEPVPVELPVPLRRWVALLPDLNFDAVFCEAPTRTLVMAMSVGLICAALVLYGRPMRASMPVDGATETSSATGATPIDGA